MTEPATLTPEIISGLKAKHGDELYAIETHGGQWVLRPSSKKEFDGLTNASRVRASLQSARHNLAIDCVVWPDSSIVADTLDHWPKTSELVCDELTIIAGGHDDVTDRLSPISLDVLTTEEALTLADAGCELGSLKARYTRKGQLVAMRTPMGVFVMRRPTRALYDEYVSEQPGPDPAGAIYNLTIGCVLHPSQEDAVRVFAKLPALPLTMGQELVRMCGSDQVLRAKKI